MVTPRPGSPRSKYPDWPDTETVKSAEDWLVQRMTINLRRERNRHGTVRALAEKTGVSASTISDILNGSVWPSVATLAQLEVALGVKLWPGVGDLKDRDS